MVTKIKNNLLMTLEQKFELLMVFSLSRELHNQKCVKIANDYADELIKIRETKILDFLYEEITERRDYSASKMCEKVIEFIEQFKNK